MCGIFGIIDYNKNLSLKDLNSLLDALSTSSADRGTHATGIAYNNGKYIKIKKKPISGVKFKPELKSHPKVVIGHTRFATQGDPKKNINNHPFLGYAGDRRFAFTHNGVIYNASSLQLELLLNSTNIDTDSYVVVQMLEKYGELSVDNLELILSKLQASLAFAILDANDDVYFVKGDNPIEIMYIPEFDIYVYASTRQILVDALIDSRLCDIIYDGEFEYVKFPMYSILKFTAEANTFKLTDYEPRYDSHLFPMRKYYDWDYGTEYEDLFNEMLAEGFTEEEASEYAQDMLMEGDWL